MSDVVLEMDHVSKKFRRGEIHDSLRDLIPALTGGMLRRSRQGPPDKREFWALDDVSFQVRRGDAFGIIGRNGAGKSTILKLLSGIMKPTKGALRVKGSLSALIEVSAGFHPDLTGRENIFLSGAILGMSREAIRAKFDEIVEFSGLAEFIDTPVKRYSSGMFARLGFSVAAHVEPDVLIIDEVLSVGDYLFQQKCVERMHTVLANGATIVFVSHNLRAVSDLCTRSLLLNRGRAVIDRADQRRHAALPERQRRPPAARRPTRKRSWLALRFGMRPARALNFESGTEGLGGRGSRRPRSVPRPGGRARVQGREPLRSVQHLDGASRASCLRDGGGGNGPLQLSSWTCTWRPGTFNLGVSVYRYDIAKAYDRVCPAATIFVTCDRDVRGAVNLYPTAVVHADATGDSPRL